MVANGLTDEVFPNPPENAEGLLLPKTLAFLSTLAKGLAEDVALVPCKVELELPNTFVPALTLAKGLAEEVLLNPLPSFG